jgi:integrase
MAKKLLTDRFVSTVKAPATGRDVYPDKKAQGLELIVFKGGRKAWSIRYRPKGLDRKRIGFGSWPAGAQQTVSLKEARDRAHDIANAALRGIDLPAQEAAAASDRRRADGRPATVAALLDRYIAGYCKANQRRWKLTERMFDAHVKPAIGETLLTELRRADIVDLLDDLQNEKGFAAQVNRVRSQIVAALNWAIEREWIETNPAAVIKKRKIETPRERVLTHDELRAIWKAADGLSDPSRTFIKVLILTGQRRDEIRCMERREVDAKEKAWTLPAERNKGKRDHTLPLPDAVVDLLDGLPKRGPYVFTVSWEKPYSGTKRLKEILDRASGVREWVLHDLRRTVRSGLAELHVGEEVAERIMNHAKKGLAKVYDRHTYAKEMRTALEAWAAHVAFIVSDARDAANVVALRPGAGP